MRKGTGKINNFKDLDVCQLGMEIVVDVYKCTKRFSKEEMYGLVSQMRRAALSIPSVMQRSLFRPGK